MLHVDHPLALIVVVLIGERKDGFLFVRRQDMLWNGGQILDFHYVCHEVWHIVGFGNDKHNLHIALFGQQEQQLLQLVARLGI